MSETYYLVAPSTVTGDQNLTNNISGGTPSSYSILAANVFDFDTYKTKTFTDMDYILIYLNQLYPTDIQFDTIMSDIASNTSQALNIILYSDQEISDNYSITYDNVSNIEQIIINTYNMPNFNNISLTNFNGLKSINILSTVTSINTLNLSGCLNLTGQLDFISNTKSVVNVDISNTKITSLKTYGQTKSIIASDDTDLNEFVISSSSNNYVENINLSNCTSLTGTLRLSDFAYLITLNLNSTNYNNVIFNKNINLETVDLGNNPYLTGTLILTLQQKLTYLDISETSFDALNVDRSNIEELKVSNTPLTSITASNTQITELDLTGTQITVCNLENDTALKTLTIPQNLIPNIINLNLGNVKLTTPINDFSLYNSAQELILNNTGITSFIPPTTKTNLTRLNLSDNSISNLDLSGFTNLSNIIYDHNSTVNLNLSGAQLGTMSVNDCPKLETLNLSNCGIKILKLKNLPVLSNLNISGNINMSEISIVNISLGTLDLTENVNLEFIELDNISDNFTININYDNNKIESFAATNLNDIPIDISKLNIQMLVLTNIKNLTYLDLSNLQNLAFFVCTNLFKLKTIKTGQTTNAIITISNTTVENITGPNFSTVLSQSNKNLKHVGGELTQIVYAMESGVRFIQIGDIIYGGTENDFLNYVKYIEDTQGSLNDLFLSCCYLWYDIESELYQKYKTVSSLWPQRFKQEGIEYITGPTTDYDPSQPLTAAGYYKVISPGLINVNNEALHVYDLNNNTARFEGFQENTIGLWLFNMNNESITNLKTYLATPDVKEIIDDFLTLYTNNDPSLFSDILDKNDNPIKVQQVQIWPDNEPVPIPEPDPEPTGDLNKFIIKFVV